MARRKSVLELRQRGLSLKQIAQRLGITHQGAAFLLKTGKQEA
jgi:DNA-binding NarL/FixJ family response regulator